MALNYITEINKFYDWLETNPVSDSSIVLWHALMHINNKCGWKNEFTVAISTLELKTGLSKSSILRSRNNLAQAGRINFKTRSGQQSAIYSMIAFHGGAQSETQTATQTVTQSGAQPVTQTVPINKLNKTKLNNSLPGDKSPAPKKQKEKNLYWKEFVDTFEQFYIKNFADKFMYMGKDWSAMDKVYKFLKKRAELKKTEWTKEYMTGAFEYFLKCAFEKDEWLKNNFTIPNMLSQFNQIVNSNVNSKINGNKNSGHTSSAGVRSLVTEEGGFGRL